MLTTDENIVDIDFEVVWNISDPSQALPVQPARSAGDDPRGVGIGDARDHLGSQLAPILNRDRGLIADRCRS
jgi:membrane protease subunit HflK